MFPLGTVLFPGGVLPLHVFEPRYRELVQVCLSGFGPAEFGVVLIERGSEVGGGDVRVAVGTRARITEAAELPDGRWYLVTVGTRRLRVTRWLPDDPYPRAEVEALEDVDGRADEHGRWSAVERLLRRALALQAEVGDPAPPATVELADDVCVAAWQAATLAPFGPADAQRVLEAETLAARLDLLQELLTDQVDVLARRATGG